MSNHRMTKGVNLPLVNEKDIVNNKRTLPFNGNAVTEKSFSFSFACFDRNHKLFNLGSNEKDRVVGGDWFIDLLDCFKSVSNKTISELRSLIIIYLLSQYCNYKKFQKCEKRY